MRIPLVKCHGSGNDFPLIDARGLAIEEAAWPRLALALADRAGPVGGDGLLLLTPGDLGADGAHAFGMRMFNSDGSEAELCLNGLRCVARAGLESMGLSEAEVLLPASAAHVTRAPDLAPGIYTVREVAGPAGLEITTWPMALGRAENVERAIEPLPSPRVFTAVAMPNPHLVAFVEEVDEAELITVGKVCEAAPAWLPRRANVSFVETREGGLFVRTFERGVGLTDSCGSAMAASTYAACLTGRVTWDREITVWNRGGLVRASASADARVTLAGNATWEWTGWAEVDPVTGTVGEVAIERRYDDEATAWAALAGGR